MAMAQGSAVDDVVAELWEWERLRLPDEDFPAAATSQVIAARGKLDMPAPLVRRLRSLHLAGCARGSLAADFLWSALDHVNGTTSYASYIGLRLLEPMPRANATEATASATHIVSEALAREVCRRADPTDQHHERRIRILRRFLERSVGPREPLSAQLRTRVRAALLPMTAEPDEAFFVRMLQAQELCFLGWAAAVQTTISELAERNIVAAELRLAELRERIRSSTLFVASLSTLDRSQFAVIRQATVGSSAIQSEGYHSFENACARASPARTRHDPHWDASATASPAVTLDEAVARARAEIGDAVLGRTVEHLLAVDVAHRGWKRTHVAVAERLIGPVRGTGGTDGVGYLRNFADAPLFPDLLASTSTLR